MSALYLGAAFVLALVCAYKALKAGRGALGGLFTLLASGCLMATAFSMALN